MTLKIAKVETILTCPDRNYLIVKITTDCGMVGWGDATLNGREKSVQAYIDAHIGPWLEGRDAMRTEDVWQSLVRHSYWRGGPVQGSAIAGIDMALWDIKGKALDVPVYEMLGGKCRDRIPVYFHAHGSTLDELVERSRARMEDGCRVIRYSFDTRDGDNVYRQPHQDIQIGTRIEVKGWEPEGLWDNDAYIEDLIKTTAGLREAIGNQVGLIHDVHERLSPIQAADVARRLEPYRLMFLEDPIEPMDKEALKLIRQSSTTPIGMGELYNSIGECMPAVSQRLIDYLRVDICHFGGITAIKKASALCEAFSIKMAFHGPSDISPLAHAAHVHVDYTIPNFGVQEFVIHGDEAFKVFKTGLKYDDGSLTLNNAPGLGVEVNEELARSCPYKPSYLPGLRGLDGSVHNW